MKTLYDNEIIMLTFGIGVFIITLMYRDRLRFLFLYKVLLSAYYFLLAGWLCTVAETIIWENFLNICEHLCYLVSSLLFAVWCFKLITKAKDVIVNE